MRLYLKIFMAAAPLYGAGMAVFFTLLFGWQAGLGVGISSGLVFGLLMSAVLGTLHHATVRKLPRHEDQPLRLGVHQVQRLIVELPYDETFDLCIASVAALKGSSVRTHDRQRGLIEIRAAMSWKSFGEQVRFEITSTGPKRCLVRVSSDPSVGSTLLDYGKNAENIQAIMTFLDARLNRMPLALSEASQPALALQNA